MNTFVELLDERATRTGNPKLWIVNGINDKTKQEWSFLVEQDPIASDGSEWAWKIDTQYFSWDKWAFDYMKKLIQEKETGIRVINHPKQKVPEICGVNGAACRHPNKCNTMLCSDCPVAEEFFAKRDGVTLQYIAEKEF